MEWKLFEGEVPHVSTFAFHEHRDRAPHIDQPTHRPRLDKAVEFILRARDLVLAADAARSTRFTSSGDGVLVRRVVDVVDLGCGDGGLLSLLKEWAWDFATYGYDFQPTNQDGWKERRVEARALNFVDDWWEVRNSDVYVITEVLEHLRDPHEMVRNIRDRGAYIVASSPWTEHATSHDECHAWAWDPDGYAKLIRDAGYDVIRHERVGMFQVVLGVPRAKA